MPMSMHVDWRQIRRWGIEPRALPPGTVVHFREPTFWEANRQWLMVAGAVMLLQAGFIAALLVERRFTKQQILQVYLNNVYLGHEGPFDVHGVAEGARFFFGKPLAALSESQMYELAAAIRAPNAASPRRHRDRPPTTRSPRPRCSRAAPSCSTAGGAARARCRGRC